MNNYPTSRKSSDPGLLYLGRVCLNGHEYQNTGMSLRYKRNGECSVCKGVRKPGIGTGYHAREIPSLEERFWRDVDKNNPLGCWEWKGNVDTAGYGHFKYGGVTHRAHRVSYELHNGKIPDGLHVLHGCDNKLCTRPDHLHLGTNADNMREKAERGLCNPVKGEANFQAKLTAEKIKQIRSIYGSGSYSMKRVGEMFGVSSATVCSIVSRRTWKHVD